MPLSIAIWLAVLVTPGAGAAARPEASPPATSCPEGCLVVVGPQIPAPGAKTWAQLVGDPRHSTGRELALTINAVQQGIDPGCSELQVRIPAARVALQLNRIPPPGAAEVKDMQGAWVPARRANLLPSHRRLLGAGRRAWDWYLSIPSQAAELVGSAARRLGAWARESVAVLHAAQPTGDDGPASAYLGL
jgi:hypothetical protein